LKRGDGEDAGREKIEALAKALAKGLKTEKDLSSLSRALLNLSVRWRRFGGEMGEHLGYEPYAATGRNSGNSRNGYSKKDSKEILEKSGLRRLATEKDLLSLNWSSKLRPVLLNLRIRFWPSLPEG